MLQKVDREVTYVAVVVHMCCKRMFLMFHLFFLNICCKSFIWMFVYVSHICCNVLQVLGDFYYCLITQVVDFYLARRLMNRRG
jgi:hypothetical protein